VTCGGRGDPPCFLQVLIPEDFKFNDLYVFILKGVAVANFASVDLARVSDRRGILRLATLAQDDHPLPDGQCSF
jgi:hypothetical protein